MASRAANQAVGRRIVVPLSMTNLSRLRGHQSTASACIPPKSIDIDRIAGALFLCAHVKGQLLSRRYGRCASIGLYLCDSLFAIRNAPTTRPQVSVLANN